MRKLTYWLVGLVLIGVAVGAVLLLNNIREITWQAAENASCEATVADQGGVDINSAFRFTFEDDVSANAVRRFLSVEPAVEFNYHRGLQAREVLAVPLEPLQPGTIYRFSLATEEDSLQWAFQTKREWRVGGSSPAYADIGVNTGAVLEFYLNQNLSVDVSNIEDYFQISPHIDGHMELDGNCLRFVPKQLWADGTVYTARLAAGMPSVGSDITLEEDYTLAFETAGSVGSQSLQQDLWQAEAMNQQFRPGQAPAFACVLPEALPAVPPVVQPETLPEGEEPPMPEQPKISASLYQYADAASYANDLQAWQERAPVWSISRIYAQGADTANLTWLSNQDLPIAGANGGAASFSWPNALQPGYYLLQANYQGQSRDIRFQVSEITAFVQSAPGSSLLWAHDVAAGLPLAEYTVLHMGSGQQAQADAGGLALLNMQWHTDYEDIFLLEQGERSLVLTEYAPHKLVDSVDIWQYLRLGQQNYKSGDSVDFWGYMRKRDGGDWEWSRVTVQVCPVDAPGEPVVQDYAPLHNNIFSGSIQLPRLLAGQYELQIWQSGQQLLAREFLVDSTVIGAAEGETSIFVNSKYQTTTPLSSDKAAYGLNENYTLSWPEAGESSGGYLFFKQSPGLTEAVVESAALYQGVFGLADAGIVFWRAVSYEDGWYQMSAPLGLPLDSSVYSLNVQLENRGHANRGQGQTVIGITVRDAAGAVPANAGVLALIARPGLDMGDMLAEMYTPHNAGTEGFSVQTAEEQTSAFQALELDKNGQAELSLAELAGSWQLYVWAVADSSLPMAGQASIMLANNTGADEEPADKPAPPVQVGRNKEAMPLFWATRYDISTGSSHYIHKSLMYFSSQERVQAMELLWQPLFSKNSTVEQRLGHAYARLLWQRHGYEDFSLPLPPVDADSLSAWQQPGGGIAAQEQEQADLFISMRVAALARDGLAHMFDTAALARYLHDQAGGGVDSERRAMALAGLAALGKPVLQDIKLMLAQEGQTPISRGVLIWGLALAGDTQVAKAAFHDFWGAYATDATSGNAYLEGGQGQNIELNRLGALAAAACGEARISFALLQYLNAQQEYDGLSTALICGGLLSSLYANPATASLTYFLAPETGDAPNSDGRAFEVKIGAFNDAWQEYAQPGNLQVDAVEGDMAMTCLRVEQ